MFRQYKDTEFKRAARDIHWYMNKMSLQAHLVRARRSELQRIFPKRYSIQYAETSVSGIVSRSISNLDLSNGPVTIKTTGDGGVVEDWSNNRWVDIIKMYQFVIDDPDTYRIPMTIQCSPTSYMAESDVWVSFHPGSSRMALMFLLTRDIKFSFFMFKNSIPTSLYYKLIGELDCTRLDDLSLEDFEKELDLASIIKSDRFIFDGEKNDNYFEISEDHQYVKNFTNDKKYTMVVSHDEIYINNIRSFYKYKQPGGTLWKIDSENIRKYNW